MPTSRSRLLAVVVLVMLGLARVPSCTANAGPNEIVLFDGTTVEAFDDLTGFEFQHGILKGTPGSLRTRDQFSNYELLIELRHFEPVGKLIINGQHWNLADEDTPDLAAPGQWTEIRVTYRNMPGEKTRLAVPGYRFRAVGNDGPAYADQNIRPAPDYPRDEHGMVVGDARRINLRTSGRVDIRRIALRPLEPASPREYFELEGEAYDRFLADGKEVYHTYCIACHGDGTGAAPSPVNRGLGTEAMLNGSDRLSLFRTLDEGYRTMTATPHLTFAEKHQVSAYVSDVLFKNHNPSQYQPVDPAVVEAMPYPLYTAEEDFARRNKTEDTVRKERGTFRDHGPLVVSPFGPDYRNAAHVLLDENTAISYDLYGMNQINVRTEGFLDMLRSQYFQQRPSSIVLPAGNPIPALTTWFWRTGQDLQIPDTGRRRVPAGHDYAFKGYYVHDREAILSYTVHGRDLLERPGVLTSGVGRVIRQQLRVGAGDQPLQLVLAEGVAALPPGGPAALQAIQSKNGTLSLLVQGETAGLRYTLEAGFLVLTIPPAETAMEFTIVRGAGTLDPALGETLTRPAPLAGAIHGGTRRWPKTYTAAGTVAEDTAAYVMDTLPVPYQNDYHAWMRTTAIAFFADGRAVVTTYGGDVWIVSGIDRALQAVTWSRFAAGLYEAFGVKVVGGLIHVTTRNGIVRLHDLNDDGEADYYEQFFADPEVSGNWHGYNFDLVHDDQGYFYYAKNGEFTDIEMEGGALRISPDGKRYIEFATGFRTPNGMGKLGDGRITYGENQGRNVPAGKIAILKKGSWHGGAVRTSPPDRVPDPPLINFPQDVDNSCGGQLWVGDSRFGPYANMLMHTSCGHARAMMIFIDEFDGTSQAATQSFPFKFDSGVMRLATNPTDGQVYLTGTRGWQVNAPQDGNLQRIRYTGKPEVLLLDVKARTGGILLSFNEPIDPASLDAGQFAVSAWNYKRTSGYGSKQYKPSEPDVVGTDTWPVTRVSRTDDPRSVWIELPTIMPTHQVRVDYQVGFESGATLGNRVHLTIHALKDR